MEKKVGSFIVFLLLLCTSIVYASNQSIVVSVYDTHNNYLQQAMVQTEFVIQVVVHNISMGNTIPALKGLDQFQYSFQGRSSNYSMHNGQSSNKTIYKFIAKALHQGVYTLGPITYTDSSGNIFTSNLVEIVVGDQQIKKQQHGSKDRFQCSVQSDAYEVFVGEKIRLQIDFLDYVGINQFTPSLPTFQDIIVTDVTQTKKQERSFDKDNQEHLHTQWVLDCYPKQVGFSVIQGIKIRLIEPNERNDFFGFMSSMMSAEKELVAEPIGIKVLPLPHCQDLENIQAVGEFSKITLSTNIDTAEQGQGFTLRVDIFGDGNLEMIDSFPLVLPQEFSSYTTHAGHIDRARTSKRFEYIIQAQESGTYEIPAQNFTYFDLNSGDYVTLQSNPKTMTITKGTHTYSDQYKLYEENELDTESENQITVSAYTILDTYDERNYWKGISLSLYALAIRVIFLLFLFMIGYRYFLKKYVLSHDKLQHFLLFLKAHRALKIAEKKENIATLYNVFITIFVGLNVGRRGEINENLIEGYLQKKCFSVDQIKKWNIFYHKLLQASFSQGDKKMSLLLVQEAFVWLSLLKNRS